MQLNKQQGFSLLEMAIVVLVIGLLMGSLLMPLSVRVNEERVADTKQQLQEIKAHLLGYAVLELRLPCPARYYEFDGSANDAEVGLPDSGLCEDEGYLPWRELGVGRYDAWGNPFRYRVDNQRYTSTIRNFTNSSDENRLRIRTLQYASDTGDDNTWLTVKSASDDTRVAVVIFSCGRNGRPDPTTGLPPSNVSLAYNYSNDRDNARNSDTACSNNGSWNNSDVYIQDAPLENAYDDVLLWISRNSLMNRLIAAQRLIADY